MVRDMAFSHFLGAGALMDAWAIAFKIPNLARRLFGEGAAASSFIPVYSETLHKDPKAAKLLARTVVTAIFVILAVIVLVGELFIWGYYKFFTTYAGTELILKLSSIMLPYMILICVVAIIAGILQTHRHFASPAAAPLVLNIILIGTFCIAGWVLKVEPAVQVFIVAVAVLVGGIVQLGMQVPALIANGVSLRPGWAVRTDEFKKIIIMMAPMILGLTVTQINTLSDDIIAKCLSGSADKGEFFLMFGRAIKYPLWDGAVSHLYYAQRLYQFPLGVLGISLATAIFPVMSAQAAKKDLDSLRKTVAMGIKGTVFVAIPAIAGLILVARPLVAAVFEHGQFTSDATTATAVTLTFYAIGLCGFFAQQILARSFYSMHDSKTPTKSAVVAVFLNLILNFILIWRMGTAGLALATAICSYVQVGILGRALRKKLGNSIGEGLIKTIVKTIIATAIMVGVGVVIMNLMASLPYNKVSNLARLAAVVPAAALVYWLAAKLLKIDMLPLISGKGAKQD